MALPNSLFNDLTASTIENRSKDAADNVLQHNAMLAQIKKAGGVKTFDGGTFINQNLTYQENGNAGSYSGYDILPTGAQDILTVAQFGWSQYAVPVAYSGRDTLTNAGKEQMIDLIATRVQNAEKTMFNMLNRHIYLDGTGNNGKNITGLGAAIPLTNTTGTYGGINRANSAFWQNQKWQASVDGGAVATAATIQTHLNQFIIRLTRGTDRPSMIVLGTALYAIFESSLQANQRFTDASSANAGFATVQFQGIPVGFDTVASGLNTNTGYFTNTDYLFWRPHAQRNMVALDDKQATNQDATVKTLAWAGNLTCSNASLQGVFSNT